VPAPQFYETRVLLSSPQEASKWLWIMTSPPTIERSFEEIPPAEIEASRPDSIVERETVIDQYEQLINEASRSFPIPPDRLDEALLMLIETSDRSRRSAIAKYRYWFGPERAREPLRRAREARRREQLRWRDDEVAEGRRAAEQHERAAEQYDQLYVEERVLRLAAPPPDYQFARQAMTFDIVPLESSPLSKTSIAKAAAESGTLAVCFFAGGPVLVIVGSIGLIAVRALSKVGSALWEGAEPEVAEFGGDVTATLLDAIRGRLGIQRRNPR